MQTTAQEQPLDVFHSLWEQENAVTFRDEYYDLCFDASHVISVATANSLAGVPPSLIDRLLVLELAPPTRDQRRMIATQIFGALRHSLATLLDEAIPEAVLDRLSAETPRRISRLLMLAVPKMVAAGRSTLLLEDIAAAAKVLTVSSDPSSRQPMGFGLASVQR